MRCVAVPAPLLAADPRYRQSDLVLRSLTELNDAALRRLGVLVPLPHHGHRDSPGAGPGATTAMEHRGGQ